MLPATFFVTFLGLGTATMLAMLATGRGRRDFSVAADVLMIVIAALLALAVVWMLGTYPRRRASGVDVGPRGIDLRTGREVIHVPWEQVQTVRFRVYLDKMLAPTDALTRRSYPRIELGLVDPAGFERAYPMAQRLRSSRWSDGGFTHAISVGTGPFIARARLQDYQPRLQAVLSDVAGPRYQGASLAKRYFTDGRR